MKPTPTLARIMALYEEQRALWERTSRLSQTERGRLLDIAQELESLWNKRRVNSRPRMYHHRRDCVIDVC
jgi:energy-coupling factor transporter ATP-binding protein EcfA2